MMCSNMLGLAIYNYLLMCKPIINKSSSLDQNYQIGAQPD